MIADMISSANVIRNANSSRISRVSRKMNTITAKLHTFTTTRIKLATLETDESVIISIGVAASRRIAEQPNIPVADCSQRSRLENRVNKILKPSASRPICTRPIITGLISSVRRLILVADKISVAIMVKINACQEAGKSWGLALNRQICISVWIVWVMVARNKRLNRSYH